MPGIVYIAPENMREKDVKVRQMERNCAVYRHI